LQGTADQAGVATPALLIVGDVVALQGSLGWFNARNGAVPPLADITRSA
jgi:hypothetical protein